MEKKGALIVVVGLLIVSLFFPLVSSLPPPVGVVGYVTDSSGNTLSGASVIVTNTILGNTDSAISNGDGLYVCSVPANNGNLLTVDVTYANLTGYNATFTNTDNLTQWLNVTATSGGLLAADFIYSPHKPKVGETVVFRDSSNGDPDAWYWNFGDGSTSVGKHQTHEYENSGTFTVSLEITKGTDSDRAQKIIVVVDDENVFIPDLQPPEYPLGYTIEECYQIVTGNKLSNTSGNARIVVMDSGIFPSDYNDVFLDRVSVNYHHSYENGYDFYGHGTFVNYEIAYLLQQKATNVEQISYRAFGSEGTSPSSVFLESLDEIKLLNPDVVSISAGAFGIPDDEYSKKVKELHDMGIIVVCAAGNSGPASATILSPACSPYVIAMGATNPEQTITNLGDDTVCLWSSRGPVLSINEVKPDAVAPGESIRGPWRNVERVKSGTSFSPPLISAGAAVCIAENRVLVDIVKTIWFWNKGVIPDAFENAVEGSCINAQDENSWGAGIVQLDETASAFHTTLIWLILLPLIIIACIIILIIVAYWKWKK